MKRGKLVLTNALPEINRRLLIKGALATSALPVIASCDTVREYTQKVIAFLTAFNSLIGGSNPTAGTPLAQLGLRNNSVPSTNGYFGTYLLADRANGGIDKAVRDYAAGEYAGNLIATRELFLENNNVALIDYHETKSGEIKQNMTKNYETILHKDLRSGKYIVAYDTAEGFFVKPFKSDSIGKLNTFIVA